MGVMLISRYGMHPVLKQRKICLQLRPIPKAKPRNLDCHKKDDISLVWVAGDVGYADDSFLHLGCFFSFCYETVFDDFMAQLQAKGGASELPWMVTPGNHEADCHDFSCITKRAYREALWNFTAYNARFKMPSGPTGGNSNMWYSFDAGPVHFVSLDLETAYPGAVSQSPSHPACLPACLPAGQPSDGRLSRIQYSPMA